MKHLTTTFTWTISELKSPHNKDFKNVWHFNFNFNINVSNKLEIAIRKEDYWK